MRINPIYKVRDVAGEHVLLLQGKNGGDMTRVVAFNASALLLWNSLSNKDFEKEDAISVLLDNYEVDRTVAEADVDKWIGTLQECNLLMH